MTKVMVVISLGFIASCFFFDYYVNGIATQIVRAMMYPY